MYVSMYVCMYVCMYVRMYIVYLKMPVFSTTAPRKGRWWSRNIYIFERLSLSLSLSLSLDQVFPKTPCCCSVVGNKQPSPFWKKIKH